MPLFIFCGGASVFFTFIIGGTGLYAVNEVSAKVDNSIVPLRDLGEFSACVPPFYRIEKSTYSQTIEAQKVLMILTFLFPVLILWKAIFCCAGIKAINDSDDSEQTADAEDPSRA